MPRKCKICSSPHRAEYEDMILRNVSYDEIIRKAKEYGEEISKAGISKHKHRHMSLKSYVNKSEYADKYINMKQLMSRADKLSTLNQLYKNMEILSKVINNLMSDTENMSDPQMLKVIKEYLGEIRMTIGVISKLEQELQTKDLSMEEIKKLMLDILSPLPEDKLIQIINRIERILGG